MNLRATSRLLFAIPLFLFGACHAVGQDDKPASEPVPLNPSKTVLLDKANNRLLLKTTLVLRDGVLEMLACPSQTKEHESILSFDGEAKIVHAGLLALGAEPGAPAKFRPEYEPPSGEKIQIFANWKDEKGRQQRVPVQHWVRHATVRYFEAPLEKVPEGVEIARKEESLRYDEFNKLLLWFGTMTEKQRNKFLAMSDNQEYRRAVQSIYKESQPREMKADFVFAGSRFAKLDDGTEHYLAEDGSLICVANFSDAMIDIDIQSSADNSAGLNYEPWTERLPEEGTAVTLELILVDRG